jgi:hypothetical protein
MWFMNRKSAAQQPHTLIMTESRRAGDHGRLEPVRRLVESVDDTLEARSTSNAAAGARPLIISDLLVWNPPRREHAHVHVVPRGGRLPCPDRTRSTISIARRAESVIRS